MKKRLVRVKLKLDSRKLMMRHFVEVSMSNAELREFKFQ